jgi:hypothetical protein
MLTLRQAHFGKLSASQCSALRQAHFGKLTSASSVHRSASHFDKLTSASSLRQAHFGKLSASQCIAMHRRAVLPTAYCPTALLPTKILPYSKTIGTSHQFPLIRFHKLSSISLVDPSIRPCCTTMVLLAPGVRSNENAKFDSGLRQPST